MKLTETKLKQIIVETLNEVNRNVHDIIKQHQLLAMENAIQSIPQSDPLFSYREKLMSLLKTPWPLNGVRQVYSLIDGMSPNSTAAQVLGDIIEKAEFFLDLKGYDREGNKLPSGSETLKKIKEKIKKIALDNRAEILKDFHPAVIGKSLHELDIVNKLYPYFRTEMEKDPEIAEIFEKVNRFFKGSNYTINGQNVLKWFRSVVYYSINFNDLVEDIMQQQLEYPQWKL